MANAESGLASVWHGCTPVILKRLTAGGSAAWPHTRCGHCFSRKSETALQRSLFEPWPSRLQPLVGR